MRGEAVRDRVLVRCELRSATEFKEPVSRFLRSRLRAAREAKLVGAPQGAVELSVLLTGDAGIRRLNATWRGKDRPTDVLSFPQESEFDLPGMPATLGDLVVSIPTARRQARERGRALEVELRTLLVHGLLHLMGHDHETDEEQLRMEEAALALGYTSHPELFEPSP